MADSECEDTLSVDRFRLGHVHVDVFGRKKCSKKEEEREMVMSTIRSASHQDERRKRCDLHNAMVAVAVAVAVRAFPIDIHSCMMLNRILSSRVHISPLKSNQDLLPVERLGS